MTTKVFDEILGRHSAGGGVFDQILSEQAALPSRQPVEEDPSFFGTIGRGLTHGVLGLAETAGTATEYIGRRLEAEPLAELGAEAKEYWSKKAEPYAPPVEFAGKTLWDNPELLGNAKWWAYNVANMIPSLAATLIPGSIAGKIAKGAKFITSSKLLEGISEKAIVRIAQGIGGGAAGGVLEGSQTYNQVLKEGGSEPEAARAGEFMAVGSGILNAIATPKVLNFTGKSFKKRVGAFFGGAFWEGITEAGEEPTEVFSRYFSKMINDEPLPDDLADQLIQSLKDGLTVFPIAGLVGGGAAVISAPNAEHQKLLDREKRLKKALELQRKSEDAAIAKGREPSEALVNAIGKTETKIAEVESGIEGIEPEPIPLTDLVEEEVSRETLPEEPEITPEIAPEAPKQVTEGIKPGDTVHTMPDGTIMPGPIHEGAVPGSERIITEEEIEGITKPEVKVEEVKPEPVPKVKEITDYSPEEYLKADEVIKAKAGWEKSSEKVIDRVKSSDPIKIIDYYAEKYNLSPILFEYGKTESKAGTYRAAETTVYQNKKGELKHTLIVRPEWEGTKAEPGIIRHEIEHIKDAQEGYLEKEPHHKRYKDFETEYVAKPPEKVKVEKKPPVVTPEPVIEPEALSKGDILLDDTVRYDGEFEEIGPQFTIVKGPATGATFYPDSADIDIVKATKAVKIKEFEKPGLEKAIEPEPIKAEKAEVKPVKPTEKKPQPGLVRDAKGKLVPFTEFKEFTRKGPNKGKFKITTTDGKKLIRKKEQIHRWPEGVEEPVVEKPVKAKKAEIEKAEPLKIDTETLKGYKVDVPIIIEETGMRVTEKQNANEAYGVVEKQMRVYDKILDCLAS